MNSPVNDHQTAARKGDTPAALEFASTDPRWELLQRVAGSQTFRKAAKLRQLLMFIGCETLAGRSEVLNEQRIGATVFGRSPDYHCAEDSIVRAQARLLRHKLESYFSGEGLAEPMTISIPRGSYVPVFEPRVPSGIPAVATISRTRRWPFALVLVAVAVVCGSLGLAVGRRHRAGLSGRAQLDHPILSRIITPDRQTLLIMQDTSLVLLNYALGRRIGLAEYQGRAYESQLESPERSDDLNRLLKMINHRQYTSLADMTLQRRLLELIPLPWNRIRIVHPRHLHPRELNNANAIFIGGAGANPWVELFESNLNFRIERHPRLFNQFRNVNPLPGEQNAYWIDGDDREQALVTFAAVALMPNPNGEGSVLILQGLNMEGTEAAGNFVLAADSVREILRASGSAIQAGMPLHFEALLECTRFAGMPTRTRPVATRLYPKPADESGHR